MNQSESTSILDRFNNEPEDAVYQSDGEYKAYGVSRHAVSLNCITKDGNQVGISWSLYSDCHWTRSFTQLLNPNCYARKLLKFLLWVKHGF